ncbi:MAG: nitroreductase family protein [Oscillibacter sp.]|nr:nitroreductase family protein [Oscillibacter sp.]
MDFTQLEKARYSLRKFSDRPVEQEKLDLVLEAARCAPTAHNNQPQRVFVLKSAEAMEKADACSAYHFHPPLMLVVAYEAEKAWVRDNDSKNHGEIDAAIVVTQMMLQAADLGLGTTYVGMFDPQALLAQFPEMAGCTPIAMLPIGYPAEGAHPARLHEDRKPMEEIVTVL